MVRRIDPKALNPTYTEYPKRSSTARSVRGALSDILSPQTAQRLAREVSDCALVEIAGAGHSVPLEQPAEFLAAVRNFV